MINKFHNIDFREIEIPPNSLIISDPPYNIKFNYPDYKDNMEKGEYIDMFRLFVGKPCVFIHYPEPMIEFICTALGVPKKTVSWVYNSNTNRQHRMIAWFNCKPDLSKVKQPYKNLKDKRIIERINRGEEGASLYDWWNVDLIKNVSEQKENYTNQIPEEIIARIIKTTAQPDQIIFDPFCGSGTTCVVADKLGHDWIGTDISPTVIKICNYRLKGTGELFK